MQFSNRKAKTVRAAQKAFFASGATHEVTWRLSRLGILERMISENEATLLESLRRDLGKPRLEAYASEIAATISELRTARHHLKRWMRPAKHQVSLFARPSSARDYPLPYGTALIVGPWNYPLNLLTVPLVSALAAGNCCILKPSEYAPATARTIAELCGRYFSPAEVACITCGAKETQQLIANRPEFVFFTGGTTAGRKVLQACASHLIPTVMELSGCNPAIVDNTVPTDVCARSLAWSKFFNAGQTCVAPNVCWVHETLVERFTQHLAKAITTFYGRNARWSASYARIVNGRHIRRLQDLLSRSGGTVVVGGDIVQSERYVAPTVMRIHDHHSPLLTGEIFGPILPVIGYRQLDAVLAHIREAPDPLVVYLFSRDTAVQDIVRRRTVSGSYAINAGMEMLAATTLPFGGVGTSGMGRYHGRFGFEAFSYRRAELRRPLHPELTLRYPPYRSPFWLMRRILRRVI